MLLIGLMPEAIRRFWITAGDDFILILSKTIAVNLGQSLGSFIITSRFKPFAVSGSSTRFIPLGKIRFDFSPKFESMAFASLASPKTEAASVLFGVISTSKT